MIRVLLVEDEPLARRTLWELLAASEGVEVVGEAADGASAVERIDALRPDLVFLDVRLPELSGLEVLARVRHRPAVVFTTAYDRYAVSAFELEAVDYLVKPFGRARFLATLERVRRRLAEGGPWAAAASPTALAEGLGGRPLSRLFARKHDRIVPVAVDSIDHVEGSDDYALLRSGAERYLVPLRLKDLEERLDPERFVRIHRSHIVNLDRVVELRPFDDHRLEVRLAGGDRIVASRVGSARLRERMRA
jgi:two-component system LytT family response regulator